MDENRKMQIELYGSIIDRLESNCFSIKSLAITIVSASIAFCSTVKFNQALVIGAVCILVLIFWHLDARYLREGRKFRNKQKSIFKVIQHGESVSSEPSSDENLLNVMISWSVLWFYGSLILLLVSVLFVLNLSANGP